MTRFRLDRRCAAVLVLYLLNRWQWYMLSPVGPPMQVQCTVRATDTGWSCDAVKASLCGTETPLSRPRMMHVWMWSSGGMILAGEKPEVSEKKPVAVVPLCRHTPRMDWTCDSNLTCAVRTESRTGRHACSWLQTLRGTIQATYLFLFFLKL
jgi:hypothetical protein